VVARVYCTVVVSMCIGGYVVSGRLLGYSRSMICGC